MANVQAKIRIADGHDSVIPVVLPDLEAVRAFAEVLQAKKAAWQGLAFGWEAEYVPQSGERPIDSQLMFTPAEFCVGESGVWFFSMTWELGPDSPAIEYLDDSGIVRS